MKRVFVQSFGCRASQADGSAIEASFRERGCTIATDANHADLVILNTCTVTHAADVDARRVIRGIHRENPGAKLAVTGCYAQRAPEEAAGIEGVDWVIGNSHKAEIANIVLPSHEQYHGRVLVADMRTAGKFRALPAGEAREDRTRPNLKVQDGCSNRCSFCIIPSVRGKSRSASFESVIEQVRGLAERYCEVVLTGINLGRWGRDLAGNLRFVDLVRALLRETGVQSLRISSVEPMDWSEPLLELIAAEPRIAKHVHAPLQSGSDSVLKRMFRKYRTRHYATRLEIARKLMPDAAIGADVMAGFPGETDAEFRETVRFIEEQPFTYLHVFTYSERPGTAAAQMPNPIPMETRRERTRFLRELSARKNLEFRRRMPGKVLQAITLEEHEMALTTNYLKVRMKEPRQPNQLVVLEIGDIGDVGLLERGLLAVL